MASNVSQQYLSKSSFIRGLQCHKSLYLDRRNPEFRDETPPSKEALFESGHKVGRIAQNLFPGGIEIPYEGLSHEEQLRMTQAEIRNGASTLYEAAFHHDGVFVKADILNKGGNGWGIYEVKSSTTVQDVHINDVAIQYYVIEGSSLPISGAFVVLINNEYVRKGDIVDNETFHIYHLISSYSIPRK